MPVVSTLYIDLETFSTNDIKKGVYRYAEQAEILLFAYAIDDGPVQVWDVTMEQAFPWDLWEILVGRTQVKYFCAHNSGFDRVILDEILPGYFDECAWRDTAVRALAHGLPAGLAMLSEIFKLPVDKAKDKDGRKLIHLFCKPQRDGSRATRLTHPKEWAQFIDYAALDIQAMRELDKKIPMWNDTEEERKLWYLDQQINDRGFAVDVELAAAAIEAVGKEKATRDAKAHELTSGAIESATQRGKLLAHILQMHGVLLPDMQISTLTRRLEDPDLPAAVKELIALRLASSGTATKKYDTLINSVSSDGRLRGTLQFCGASRTGRWSGRIFQPQNLPRPTYKNWEIDLGIEAMKYRGADLIWGNVTDLASSAIRGVIVAPPGKKLVVSDLSSIEGRMLAWLAGEDWKVKAYQDFDAGIGYDMYVLTYAKTFGIAPADVTKAQRQLGKVLELALGYGGAIGAFVSFANVYGIDLQELAGGSFPAHIREQSERYWAHREKQGDTLGFTREVFVACDSIKRMWREANALIVTYWGALEHDVKAVLHIGGAIERKRYTVDKKGTWVRIKLPSGRYLCYAGARDDDGTIKYLGVNQYSRKWGHLTTYSGKLAENCTQGASRDVLAHGLQLAEGAGYKVVLSVHDELITETPDSPEFNAKHLSDILATVPPWAKGLPLSAAGFEGYRYRKD